MIPALQRVARSVLVLLVVMTLTFAIFYLAPIDPALQMCGKPCSPEDLEAARGFMGFDQPWFVQLGTFLVAIFTGRTFGSAEVAVQCAAPCLGYSFQLHQSVTELIVDRFPVTFSIALGAVALQALFGIAAGALAARRQGGILDRTVTGVSVVAASAPAFVVGLLAVVVFALQLDLLPSGGYEPFTESPLQWARHLVLPWITLAFLNGAVYARLVRSSMIEQLGLDYARTARAAGLPERRIDRYALRNLALPLTTLIALDIGALLGGTVITERIFGLPGLGALLLDATSTADLPVIVGTTLVGSLLIVLANLCADLARPLLDRRLAATGRRTSALSDPTDPTDPDSLADPVDPTEASSPVDPTEASSPVDPTHRTTPSDPKAPTPQETSS
ncbi:ABC transporter permease subunit [Brachybacterium muris]|uniref:ABC transporter permease n=1 Tax=Brachybacterium muris TaxID=219301 RepID=UPI00223C37DB|nr:ABC transporter permease [Brachybacterium muris]MCT1996880.1 ABC transporter permease subunit [Brachybacterium muris]MCT2296087.1 ABC transporter permease subunit [Brachybacterium muris]